MEISADWVGGLAFNSKGGSGHEVLMDASRDVGGDDKGPRPMELLLHGIAGCTGIDIVKTLEKMKADIDDFKISVDGKRADDYPQKFIEINIHFIIEGSGLTEKKVSRAVNLSLDKYCSASNSLSAKVTGTYEIISTE
ncbi:OsmC family protein [Halanaerobiaceae bacterium Z-7014]|uniref:OsmC family protein n=1 Tax=Halonatronomonas betaini TaxID=2778430 RepID=A0A931ASB5_9FIRM|nr:OsmC family protein [Halonatronomonas betaini]MBF8438108.1 OsmC family protein [Halonatronomonas betaini]